MAYWLYCQSCEQWSKSTTPMSDDKSCSFCSKPYVSVVKSSINSNLDQEVAENSRELEQDIEALEIPATMEPDTSEKVDIKEIFPSQEITEPAVTPDISESIGLQEVETPEIPEKDEIVEIREEFESLETESSPEDEEAFENADLTEELETNNTDPKETKPKMTRTHEKFLEKKRRMKNSP